MLRHSPRVRHRIFGRCQGTVVPRRHTIFPGTLAKPTVRAEEALSVDPLTQYYADVKAALQMIHTSSLRHPGTLGPPG